MHALHARVGKHFDLAQKIQRNHHYIEEHPESLRGKWATWAAPCQADSTGAQLKLSSFREVRLDLGCGKGSFTLAKALREPDVLFLGMDAEPLCIALAAEKAAAQGLSNLLFFPGSAEHIEKIFGEGELARVYINFPTPFPRTKEAKKRLVYLDNLLRLRNCVQEDALLIFKSDSFPLVHFAKTQFVRAGWELILHLDDLHKERAQRACVGADAGDLDADAGGLAHDLAHDLTHDLTRELIHDPTSEYEEKLTAKGAKVFVRVYTKGQVPAREKLTQVESLSLQDYLPQDLSQMDYVPSGMEGTVLNLINYSKKHNNQRLQRQLADE